MKPRPQVVTWLLLMMVLVCGGHGGGRPAVTGAATVTDGDLFDYIVVGAGAAGSALAARLALGGRRTLLVEAGGDPGLLSKIPNAASALLGSHNDWFYETVPNNKSCLAHRGRQCHFSRGRCLGGSTSINYMLYTRGNPRDYDFHISGWSWPHLKPYFLRYEGLRNSNLPPSSRRYHNTSGPVAIGPFDRSSNAWNERIVEGLATLKFPFNSDVNARSQIGVSRVLGYVAGGERVSSATAYLYSHDVRKNLTVASNVKCIGVIIDENNVAHGVTVMKSVRNARPMRLYARREVILSAGTIGSAHVLMLSGIGVADHLRAMGIPVRAALPVGDGMSDHVMPLLFLTVDHDSTAPNLYKILGAQVLNIIQWLATRTSPLASVGVTDVVAFANTHCYDLKSHQLKNNDSACDIPSLQIIFAYVDRYISHIVPRALKRIFNNDVFEQILAANRNNALLIVSPILLRPRSNGRVRLSSADPSVTPAIAPHYLEDEADVDELVKSIAIIEQLVQTPAFSRNNASLVKLHLAGCPAGGDNGYWRCYVRHMTTSAQHAVGTAQLGKVVDGALRVRGVRGLRVADLSVLPRVPRGNTAAVAIALGERLADILSEQRND